MINIYIHAINTYICNVFIYLKERRVYFQEFIYHEEKKKKNKAEPQNKFSHVVRNRDFRFIQPISFRMTRATNYSIEEMEFPFIRF